MNNKGKIYFGIRDIAKKAGVSTATVSRVINTPNLASIAMQKKVRSVINEYNYVPNLMAKNLFSQSSNSIAIFIYDIQNPFFATMIKELNNIAFENKVPLLICDTENNINKEKEYLNYCQSIRCTGIIITEGVDYDLFSTYNTFKAIAYLDRGADPSFSCVSSDNHTGMQKLIDYLYNLNHRKIAFAGAINKFQSAIERKQGYIDVLTSHKIEINQNYIFDGNFSYETGVKALEYFWSLNDKPTAIVCANDQIAQGLIMMAYKLNISVPDDLSVVGFDGVDLSYFYPKITTIKQDIKQIAQALFDAATKPNNAPIHKTVDISIVIGESCKKIALT